LENRINHIVGQGFLTIIVTDASVERRSVL
jgi:hypothetical protein